MLTVFGRVVPWHKDCWRHRAKKQAEQFFFSISASSKKLMDFHSQCLKPFDGFPTVDGSEIRQTTWDVSQNPVNNGLINYQPQLVSLPDFWTIKRIKVMVFFEHMILWCLFFWRSVSQLDDHIGAYNRTGKKPLEMMGPSKLGTVSQMDVLK